MNDKWSTDAMDLINGVAEFRCEQRKSSQIMVRVSPDFRKLLDHCVRASGCRGYSDFVRKLVMVSSVNAYEGEL